MKRYKRILNLPELLSEKSYFLLGPRQTGKTFLVDEQLALRALVIDLLKSEVFLALQKHPERLREYIIPDSGLVVIDEVQRIPELLNEVHLLIEKQHVIFLLTGSSARKLRRSGVNLLGGRARSLHLYPLVFAEIGEDFDLQKVLRQGTLPTHYLSNQSEKDLKAYCENYLQLEIAAEGAVRNLSAFGRFLEVASLCNAQILNYSNIANDAQVAPSTVQEYFQILRDTLIGRDLPVWKESKKRKASRTSKFYFFDVGVVRTLQERPVPTWNSREMGEYFETYLFHELSAYTEYFEKKPLTYWRSLRGDEVDFILDETVAIEVKLTQNATKQDFKCLRALQDEGVHERFLLVCREPLRRMVDGIEIFPVEEFLSQLWSHEIITRGEA